MGKILKNDITLIIGDSWGCGEWSDSNQQKDREIGSYPQHPGLAGFLIDHGETVVNLSIPAGSLNDIKTTLENFLLANYFNNNIKKVYCIQTSVFRDYIDDDFSSLDHYNINSFQDFVFIVLYEFYKNLNKQSNIYNNFPIYVIGGLMDSPDQSFFNKHHFSSIRIACQSWVNLCLNNDSTMDHLVTWDYCNPNLIEYLVKEKKVAKQDIIQNFKFFNDRKKSVDRNPDLFYPDGEHTNRLGHKILFNFLKNKNFV